MYEDKSSYMAFFFLNDELEEMNGVYITSIQLFEFFVN